MTRSPPAATGTRRTRSASRCCASGSEPRVAGFATSSIACVAATRRALAALLAGGGLLAGWGLFEAQWLERRELRVPVAGLPAELDGLSILHLSDFHAGTPSLNLRTMQAAVAYGVSQQPDMVVVTGDIIAHPRGQQPVFDQLARLHPPRRGHHAGGLAWYRHDACAVPAAGAAGGVTPAPHGRLTGRRPRAHAARPSHRQMSSPSRPRPPARPAAGGCRRWPSWP